MSKRTRDKLFNRIYKIDDINIDHLISVFGKNISGIIADYARYNYMFRVPDPKDKYWINHINATRKLSSPVTRKSDGLQWNSIIEYNVQQTHWCSKRRDKLIHREVKRLQRHTLYRKINYIDNEELTSDIADKIKKEFHEMIDRTEQFIWPDRVSDIISEDFRIPSSDHRDTFM
jgi:hypothetical protein